MKNKEHQLAFPQPFCDDMAARLSWGHLSYSAPLIPIEKWILHPVDKIDDPSQIQTKLFKTQSKIVSYIKFNECFPQYFDPFGKT